MKSSSPIERHFLLTTALLVLFLGGSATYSLFKEPLKSDARLGLALRGEALKRQPAGVVLAEEIESRQEVPVSQGKSLAIDIPCESKNLGELQVSHLRLRGTRCGRVEKVEKNDRKNLDENLAENVEVSVQNMTNGFTAQVIGLKNQKFTTDFIDLVEGNNQLKIIRKNAAGQVEEQQIQVKRLPASLPDEKPNEEITQ